jgi:hypothetical protein
VAGQERKSCESIVQVDNRKDVTLHGLDGWTFELTLQKSLGPLVVSINLGATLRTAQALRLHMRPLDATSLEQQELQRRILSS